MFMTDLRRGPLLALTLAAACTGDIPVDGVSVGQSASQGSMTAIPEPTAAPLTTSDGTSGGGNSDGATSSGATSSGASSAGSTESDSGGSAETGGVKYDVGAVSSTGITTDGMSDACQKVDLLFVVDDSSSMYDQQVSLINSFPGFVTGVQANLASADSYHIGVVTSDAYEGNEVGCQDIGDLVTKTDGYKSSQQTCTPFSSGMRFMDQTEPDLGAKFACAANPGILGADDERVMRSLLDALSPAKGDPGGCNEGFLRQDALLVVVIITDEDDAPNPNGNGSGGTPQSWYDEIVSYKSGIAENIVVLSLVGQGPVSSCDAVVNSNIVDFTNLFGGNGFIGDVCWSDYSTFFADALPVVDMACDDYVPPR